MPATRGRKKKAKTLERAISLRIDGDLVDDVQDYLDGSGISMSHSIRQWFRYLQACRQSGLDPLQVLADLTTTQTAK